MKVFLLRFLTHFSFPFNLNFILLKPFVKCLLTPWFPKGLKSSCGFKCWSLLAFESTLYKAWQSSRSFWTLKFVVSWGVTNLIKRKGWALMSFLLCAVYLSISVSDLAERIFIRRGKLTSQECKISVSAENGIRGRLAAWSLKIETFPWFFRFLSILNCSSEW